MGELREGYATGPDERRLRIVERVIDLGDDGRFLIQVAGDAAEIERHHRELPLALALTFGLLALALAATTLFQVRFGLQPLSRLRQRSARSGAGRPTGSRAIIPTTSPRWRPRSTC